MVRSLLFFTPLPVAVFAQAPLLLLDHYRSPAWARLSSPFLRKLQPGIMNHISRRAAAGTNADAGLVHHRERKMTLHHSPGIRVAQYCTAIANAECRHSRVISSPQWPS